ncbi:MAG: potassium channel protein, partial [Desulfobacterales bacterium]
MERTKLFFTTIFLSLVLLMLGALGYMVIEGWSFLDAIYMTVITLATVGYG